MIQFAITLFISAVLLFVVQPMAAKALLPLFGGVPMVWTVCMMYFQAVLLLAYGYAYALTHFFKLRMQQAIHCLFALLSILVLPILWHTLPLQVSGDPTLVLLKLLFTKLTLPLWVVSSSAPLLQAWFSHTKHPQSHDPYFLYAASNLGSFVALLGYPFLIERSIGLSHQSWLWSACFIAYLLLLLLIVIFPRYKKLDHLRLVTKKSTWSMRLKWLYLSFTPVSLMLGVTFYITTDIASMPLFWVIPLAIYLLTYVLTFATKPLIKHQSVVNNVLFILIFAIVGFIFGYTSTHIFELIVINLLTFFMLAMLCHGELVKSRPDSSMLTQFYFFIALGGLLAGIFNSILAPLIFTRAWEYPIAILLAILALPLKGQVKRWWMQPLIIFCLLLLNHVLPESIALFASLKYYHVLELVSLVIIVTASYNTSRLFISLCILFAFIFIIPKDEVLWQGRNFYGIKRIVKIGTTHRMFSQTTVHGAQNFLHDREKIKKSSYYAASVDLANLYPDGNIAIVGLGVGIIACQFDQRATLTLYEIDPQVVAVAKNENYFTVLKKCQAKAPIKLGDARLNIVREKDKHFNLIILDAFNSDAIPSHLLTKEALSMYFDKLKSGGSLLVHISNRHINLVPVLASYAKKHEYTLLFRRFKPKHNWQYKAEWVVLTRNPTVVQELLWNKWIRVLTNQTIEWTDDYSNIMPLLK
jgi:spermidine synthase